MPEVGSAAKTPGCDDVIKQTNFLKHTPQNELKIEKLPLCYKNFSVKCAPGAAITR
jgi:hypothetical protein